VPRQKSLPAKTRTSLKILLGLQTGTILFFVYWMLSEYDHNDYFRIYVNTTFLKYLTPLMLLTMGVGGLGACASAALVSFYYEKRTSKKTSPVSTPSIHWPSMPSFRRSSPPVLAAPPVPVPDPPLDPFSKLVLSSPREQEKRSLGNTT